MIKRFKKWKDWRRYNCQSKFYQFLVLIGVAKSLSFDTWYIPKNNNDLEDLMRRMLK